MFAKQYEQFEKRIDKYQKGPEYRQALDYRIFIQSFAAFIIARSNQETKKDKIKALQEYFADSYVNKALKNVSAKTFSLLFKPFFIAVKKKHIGFCLAYMKLAMRYRDSK